MSNGIASTIPIQVRVPVRELASLALALAASNINVGNKGSVVQCAMTIAYDRMVEKGLATPIDTVEEAYGIITNLGLDARAGARVPTALRAALSDNTGITKEGERQKCKLQ